jgi:hypothetical protein
MNAAEIIGHDSTIASANHFLLNAILNDIVADDVEL